MRAAISKCTTSFFNMLTRGFSAGEAAAGAVENIALAAETTTATFRDEVVAESAMQRLEFEAKHSAKLKELGLLPAPKPAPEQ